MDVKVINKIYDWMIIRYEEYICLEIFDYLLNEEDGFVRDNIN